MFDPLALIRSRSAPMEPIPTGVAPRLQPMAGIRAVAFDLYGTLFLSGAGGSDTGDAFSEEAALRGAFSRAGLRTVPGEVSLISGYRQKIRDHHAVRRAEGIEFPEVEIRSVWREWLGEMRSLDWFRGDTAAPGLPERLCLEFECAAHPVWPMPGLVKMITGLRDRGIPLGIVSNAQFYTPLLFPSLLGLAPEALGFEEDLTVYSHQLLEAKPSPLPFRVLADGLAKRGLTPAETLYIGNDIRNDIRPAQSLGYRTALFAGDARSLRLHQADPALAAIVPDLVITDLRQVSACLIPRGV